jgi:C-terminal processing protease CtpA/Prc
MKLNPGAMHGLVDRQDYLGLVLGNTDRGVLLVEKVIPGSIASRSGFVSNDELIDIDGKRISDSSWAIIARQLGLMTKKDMTFTVRQGNKVRSIVVSGG